MQDLLKEKRKQKQFKITSNDRLPLDSDVVWPLNESVEISLVLDISTDSEVLSLGLEEV